MANDEKHPQAGKIPIKGARQRVWQCRVTKRQERSATQRCCHWEDMDLTTVGASC